MVNLMQPMLGMMAVTAGVWSVMYIKRLSYINKYNIEPEHINTPEKANVALPDSVNHASNNFKNLFEMPVIFYALCLGAQLMVIQNMSTEQTYQDNIIGVVGLYFIAWSYVLLRALHSIVQSTYNNVMHRFTLYFLSCLVLWWMAFKVAIMAWSL